ncbi:MAG TPA: FecR domain-containing protein [Candidatus Paceibacterota bacterium]|nr:FecR domain-containing protein [Candidatus Paceibacterota bacterium]
MKHMKYFVSIGVAVLAFATIASAQSATQGIATVVRIQGTARYSTGDNVWHTLTTGTTLGENDVVQTAANSTVDLVLGDKAVRVNSGAGAGSLIGGTVNIAGLPVTPISAGGLAAPEQNIVRLLPDTELAIDTFNYSQTGADSVTDTELNLKTGKIFANVKKISAASKFIVKTPTGVAGIRGTSVYFSADGSCTVVDGSAVISEVINNQTVTVTLTAGQYFDAATGQVSNLNSDAEAIEDHQVASIISSVNGSATISQLATVNKAVSVDVTSIHISPNSGTDSNSGTD